MTFRLHEMNMFINHQSERARKNRTGVPQRAGFDLDYWYDTHEEFVEAVSVFLKQYDGHKFDLTALPLKLSKASLSSTFCIGNDASIEYYFHLQHAHERRDGTKYSFTCPASVEDRPTERDPSTIHRYAEYFERHGEFHKPEAHIITRKQVYNVWLSPTQGEWHRDVDDFKSAQLLVAEKDAYELLQGLQEPETSLAILTPCFTNSQKFNHAKMTEVDGTFGTNKHGFELYCVLTEYDIVSLPLSYLLLGKLQKGITVDDVAHGVVKCGVEAEMGPH
ncbi:hypothetical protein V1505DRAFT_379032 [Lipomyces doorenjongii]